MTSAEITFDKLVYIDRLKSAGVAELHARAHAEALDQALRDTVATKSDLQHLRDELQKEMHGLRGEIVRFDNKIDVAIRDLTIRMGGNRNYSFRRARVYQILRLIAVTPLAHESF